MTIQNNLHFYIPDLTNARYTLKNIINWAACSPMYAVHIWVQEDRTVLCSKELIVLLLDLKEITPRTERSPESVREHPFYDPEEVVAYSRTVGREFIIYSKTKGTFNIFIGETQHLARPTDNSFYADESLLWKNLRGAEQYIKLWVLYTHGGVFFDNSVLANYRTLPPNINAPKGILFFMVLGASPPIFTNTVIAAPKGSNSLLRLLGLTERMYRDEYTHFGHLENRMKPETEATYARVEELRALLLTRASIFDWRNRRIQRRRRDELNTILHQRAVTHAADTVITFWVDMLEHALAPDHTEQLEELAEHGDYNFTLHTEKILDAEYYLYSFSEQSGMELFTKTEEDYILV